MEEKELPSELQGLSLKQKQSYIDEKLATRTDLEDSMSKLIKKYDGFVAEQSKASSETDSFDQAVQETLREQLN